MVRCPVCTRECADKSRFCASCAAPLDATSAETVVLGSGAASVPRPSAASSVDEGRFLPGTVLAGRYRIAGLLGRGGMGEVYRATGLTLGQAVALKFLPEATASDDRALARFYNEVRIARQVTHPNVCRVYDVGVAEGLHYISMEFVDGEDLGSLLNFSDRKSTRLNSSHANIYTLSLHDALPISPQRMPRLRRRRGRRAALHFHGVRGWRGSGIAAELFRLVRSEEDTSELQS